MIIAIEDLPLPFGAVSCEILLLSRSLHLSFHMKTYLKSVSCFSVILTHSLKSFFFVKVFIKFFSYGKKIIPCDKNSLIFLESSVALPIYSNSQPVSLTLRLRFGIGFVKNLLSLLPGCLHQSLQHSDKK